MSNHKPNPIRVLQHSDALKLSFDMLSQDSKNTFEIEFFDFTGEEDLGDDCISVGDNFHILATDDNRFYVQPTRNDPTDSWEDITERGSTALDDLNSGTPIDLILPKVGIKSYYGKYVDDCSDAIRLAITWLSLSPEELPKEYNPPVFTPR